MPKHATSLGLRSSAVLCSIDWLVPINDAEYPRRTKTSFTPRWKPEILRVNMLRQNKRFMNTENTWTAVTVRYSMLQLKTDKVSDLIQQRVRGTNEQQRTYRMAR